MWCSCNASVNMDTCLSYTVVLVRMTSMLEKIVGKEINCHVDQTRSPQKD